MITPGEPAGIRPDLVVQLAQREWPVELVVCADAALPYRPGSDARFAAHPPPLFPNSPAQPRTSSITLLPLVRYVNLSLRGS
ncbi:hypothetical protein ACLB1T_17020 [Escherichia coli]